MTAVAELSAEAGDRLARRNAVILAVAQTLGLSNNIIMITTGSIVGAMLAPTPALATLPISIQVVGMWSGTLPMGLLAKRYGRRFAFQLGTMFGVLTGLLCSTAVLTSSFTLLCLGAFCTGFYAAAQQAYRFAAADTASDAFRPKAISWVLLGGIGGALLGPTLLMLTQDILAPPLFVVSYLGQTVLALVSVGVLSLLNIPKPAPPKAGTGGGRPLGVIARQPRFMAAVAAGVASYSIMNMIMTSAPLAMVMCGHTPRDAAFGIQMHALAMYVPSFFTGALIARFGVERIVSVGLALLAASAVADMSGIGLVHFWSGLILVGLGWNFAFIGATAMVTQCYRPEERNTVQAFNDFMVFGTMALGSFLSGALLATHGWNWVNSAVFPVVALAAALLAWDTWRRRHPPMVGQT